MNSKPHTVEINLLNGQGLRLSGIKELIPPVSGDGLFIVEHETGDTTVIPMAAVAALRLLKDAPTNLVAPQKPSIIPAR